MEVDYATKQADTTTRIGLPWKQRPAVTACGRSDTSELQWTYHGRQAHYPARRL